MHVNIIPRDRIEQASTEELRHAYNVVRCELERCAASDPHSEDARLTHEEALRYHEELKSRRLMAAGV